MTLPQHLLEKLACPNCKGDTLEYRDDQQCLVCDNCKLSYWIVDDVPVLLVDEAEKIE
jgi:uncharacterized protein YbaR (Trm112 family)